MRLGLTVSRRLPTTSRYDGNAEIDGLPVPVLDALVREFIESHLDPDIQVQAEGGCGPRLSGNWGLPLRIARKSILPILARAGHGRGLVGFDLK